MFYKHATCSLISDGQGQLFDFLSALVADMGTVKAEGRHRHILISVF